MDEYETRDFWDNKSVEFVDTTDYKKFFKLPVQVVTHKLEKIDHGTYYELVFIPEINKIE